MVTAPISDNGMLLVNTPNLKGVNASKNLGTLDFTATMQEASRKTQECKMTAEQKTVQPEKKCFSAKEETTKALDDTDSDGQTNSSQEVVAEDKVEEAEEVQEAVPDVTAEMKDEIKKAAKELLHKIAEVLDISEEDMMEAMACLEMPITDILTEDSMVNLVVELSGEDMMSLMTNEELYTDIQELTGELQQTLEGLLEQLGITQEMLEQACKAVKAETGMVDVQAFEQNLGNILSQEEPVILIQKETPKEPTLSVPEGITKGEDKPIEELPIEELPIEEMPIEDNVLPTAEDASDMQENQSQQADTKGKTEMPVHKKSEHSSGQALQNPNAPLQYDAEATVTKLTTGENTLYHMDTDKIMKQIMDYMNVKVKEGITEMEMQLHPSSLGTVNLQIASRGGSVTAQFTVQNEAVKSAMETQIVQLKEDLENQGVKVEAVEVTLASHGFERNLSEHNQEQSEQNTQHKVKTNRRRIINLNEYSAMDAIQEETDDATRIAMEMMSSNGNSLDMLA